MERPSAEELFEKYGRYARRLAQPYAESNPRFAVDLKQCANVALLVAADGFDWEACDEYRGFPSYLRRAIQSECRDFIASMAYSSSGSRWALGDDQKLHGFGSVRGAFTYGDGPWDDEADARDFDLILEVADSVLHGRQREAFLRYYVDGICSDSHVAELMGVQQPAASKLRQRAEARIREEFDLMEYL